VATGLDSMVVGEAQILGQLRDAYALATERDTAGRLIHDLMQQALRVGKRAHAETDIDRAGRNIVSAALTQAAEHLPTRAIEGSTALVVGAGSMGALALATLRRSGAGQLFVTNRDAVRANRLAVLHGATAVPFEDLAAAVATVDLVVCATAAPEHVLHRDDVVGPLVVLDLAVPRDVEPGVADVPGVVLLDMERLAVGIRDDKTSDPLLADEVAVESIVAAEVAAFQLLLRGAEVAPTVAALRAQADDLVATELHRLHQRRADLTEEQRADVAQTVHRIVQRLLHSPTVRVRELAAGPGGDRYTALLRELFDLDVPPTAETVGDVPADVTDGGSS
jgi:glutamyl-tRNA reductase